MCGELLICVENQQFATHTLGQGWQRAFHPDELASVIEKLRAILLSGGPGEAEARMRRFDGEYRWFLIRAEPVRDEHGNVVRWFGTSTLASGPPNQRRIDRA